MSRIYGLIAGAGELPRLIVQALQARGDQVVVIRFIGTTGPGFDHLPGAEVGMGEIGKAIATFKAHKAEVISFAGYVKRPDLKTLKVDAKGAMLLPSLIAAGMKGDGALLETIIRAFEKDGLAVIGAEALVADLLCPEGVLGQHQPGDSDQADIAKAQAIIETLGPFDVGQGAVVCGGLALAIEAQEGTDAMLTRVATLPEDVRGTAAQRRGVLVKVPKPGQDGRIDLPTVGVRTIEGAAAAGLAGVALAAGRGLIVDQPKVVAAADAAGLFLLGHRIQAPRS